MFPLRTADINERLRAAKQYCTPDREFIASKTKVLAATLPAR
jgi:hypothetical protein